MGGFTLSPAVYVMYMYGARGNIRPPPFYKLKTLTKIAICYNFGLIVKGVYRNTTFLLI